MNREKTVRVGLTVLLAAGWGILQLCNRRIGNPTSGEVILIMAAIAVWSAPVPRTFRQKIVCSLAYAFIFLCYTALYLAGKYGI